MSKNKRQLLLLHSGVMIITAHEIYTEEEKRNKTECHETEEIQDIVSFFLFSFFFFFFSSVPHINSSCNSNHCCTKDCASKNISSPKTL